MPPAPIHPSTQPPIHHLTHKKPCLTGGISEQQYVQLRSEAKAPFRLTRIIFIGGLAVGAALGLFIITGRLLAALQGGWSHDGVGRAGVLVITPHHLCACNH